MSSNIAWSVSDEVNLLNVYEMELAALLMSTVGLPHWRTG